MTNEERARELADHCRYCGMPDYRFRCIRDFEQSVADIAAALDEKDARIAELETDIVILKNPRVTQEDWHKLALMYRDQVAALEREMDKDQRLQLNQMDDALAAAKIEGLKMARSISEAISLELGEYENRWSINEAIDRIDCEIAKLEGK